GTAAAHGSPLGEDEIALARQALDWPYQPFHVPDDIYAGWDCRQKGSEKESAWRQQYADYAAAHPELAAELERRLAGDLPGNWEEEMSSLLQATQAAGTAKATRSASGEVIERLASLLPEMLGGSADLSGSNCTHWPAAVALTADQADANYIYYGVREFGMTAIGNGIALHGGLRPFSGTFLIFMEYARNAVRLASLMGTRHLLVYSHDSIGQGEDGPTHQPIEQLANLRTTPNLSVWRPCDAVETVAAWKAAIERRDGPTALVLSRQGLPAQDRTQSQLADIARGAYTLFETSPQPELLLIATGSEVAIALEAGKRLADEGAQLRVVSMPSADVFDAQDESYREAVLPQAVRKRVAVEASQVDYWRKWVGMDGRVVGMTSFGESAPGADLFKHFGFTAEAVIAAAKNL
ncbi:MAG: transketolase-like TK C-terminal-containing protein, partial [Pseudomonadales bacterium]